MSSPPSPEALLNGFKESPDGTLKPKAPTLDLRPAAAYNQHRILGSTNIPLPDLLKCLYTLPDREQPFGLVLPSAIQYHLVPTESEAEAWNNERNRTAAEPSTSGRPPAVYLKGFTAVDVFLKDRGWGNHTFCVTDSDDTWQLAKSMGLLEEGGDITALKRRWMFRPAKLLQQEIDRIEVMLAQDRTSQGLAEGNTVTVRALDVGCGSGRDLAWLVTRCAKHRLTQLEASGQPTEVIVKWKMTGLDSWIGQLVRTEELLQLGDVPTNDVVLYCAEIVSETGQLQTAKLAKDTPANSIYIKDLAPLLNNHYDLVLFVRFLERPFMSRVRDLLRVGGFVVYCHFLDMEGTQKFGRPTLPEQRLKPGELAAWFGQRHGFEVLQDEFDPLADGREMSMFVARKVRLS